MRSNSNEAAALWEVNGALREAEFGNVSEAKQRVHSALARAPGRDVRVLAALTLARAGDAEGAKAIADRLEKEHPTNTILRLYWLPTIRAAIALERGNSARALMELEATGPMELGVVDPLADLGTLYPAYLRGLAQLRVRNGNAAAAEFQKFLDHRGIVSQFPLAAIAHLQLARAHALSGDKPGARSEYDQFLSVWKDADSSVPLLTQAKAESAKLPRGTS
jgi:hypothetical protein